MLLQGDWWGGQGVGERKNDCQPHEIVGVYNLELEAGQRNALLLDVLEPLGIGLAQVLLLLDWERASGDRVRL